MLVDITVFTPRPDCPHLRPGEVLISVLDGWEEEDSWQRLLEVDADHYENEFTPDGIWAQAPDGSRRDLLPTFVDEANALRLDRIEEELHQRDEREMLR